LPRFFIGKDCEKNRRFFFFTHNEVLL
jgi:hypothetical protein